MSNLLPTPVPSAAQLAYQATETNVFFHFGINTYTDREWGDGSEDPFLFNPEKLDCAQWARTARIAGFKIAILTAKHHDGFCLWPSRSTTHSVRSAQWKNGQGDVVREFVDAFRAEGLQVGLYLSPWDRHEPSYGSDHYNDFYCRQLTELLTEYGPLHEVWFDGACAEGPSGRKQVYDWPRYFRLVQELQPGAVTFGDGGTDVRWVGNERGIAGATCWSTIDPEAIRFPGDSGIAQANDARASLGKEQLLNEGQIPDGSGVRVWRPAECDVSIRPGWFYHEAEDDQVRSSADLVDLYFLSVGRNGTLLLNIPPTREGLLHAQDIESVSGFRRKLDRIFAQDLAQDAEITSSSEATGHAAPCLLDGDPASYWTSAAEDAQPTLELHFPEPREIGVICLQECVRLGQRISSYRIEARVADGTWQGIASGTTIGFKKLDRVGPLVAGRLRIVLESLNSPALSRLSVYPAPRLISEEGSR